MKSNVEKPSVSYLLIHICKARMNRTNKMLGAHGLYAGQDVLLYFLGQEDGQTVSSLAEKVSIRQATMVRMIDRLAAGGFVRKVKDNEDRRISRIFLTKRGKTAADAAVSVWKELERKATAGISPEEKETLRGTLGNILKNLQ